MFLRNHGVVVCGKDIESAHMLLCTLMDACNTQVGALVVKIKDKDIIAINIEVLYLNSNHF